MGDGEEIWVTGEEGMTEMSEARRGMGEKGFGLSWQPIQYGVRDARLLVE